MATHRTTCLPARLFVRGRGALARCGASGAVALARAAFRRTSAGAIACVRSWSDELTRQPALATTRSSGSSRGIGDILQMRRCHRPTSSTRRPPRRRLRQSSASSHGGQAFSSTRRRRQGLGGASAAFAVTFSTCGTLYRHATHMPTRTRATRDGPMNPRELSALRLAALCAALLRTSEPLPPWAKPARPNARKRRRRTTSACVEPRYTPADGSAEGQAQGR